MAYSDAQKRATMKWRKENYKHLSFDIKNSFYDEIKAAAENKNESVNGYIKKAVETRLKNDL